MHNSTVESNYAEFQGGAAFAQAEGEMFVQDTVFRRNMARQGMYVCMLCMYGHV
jgi:hypothetical protein